MSLGKTFNRFASWASRAAGTPTATIIALWLVLVWALSGPFFKFGETWQLVINTGTTIITFLMVFVIQHSQNCDSTAVHIKLDEIIRVLHRADNSLLDLEHLDQRQLDQLQKVYRNLAANARDKPACATPGPGDDEPDGKPSAA